MIDETDVEGHKSSNIFITFTPYHIILAYGLARASYAKSSNQLIIIADFENADKIYSILKNMDQSPFQKIHFRLGRYGTKEFGTTRITRMTKNIKVIKKIYDHTQLPIYAYIFNDANAEGQYLAYLNKKHGGINVYVEDGFGAYSNSKLKKLSPPLEFASKILYGKWYENIIVLGTSEHIDRSLLHSPQFARKELRKRPIYRIDTEIIGLAQSLCEHIVRFNEIDLANIPPTIVILPHSSFIDSFNSPTIINTYRSLIEKIIDKGERLAIKYHPREEKRDYIGICGPQLFEIPRSIPIEALFIGLIEKPPKTIIGDISTSLLTAKKLFDNRTNVISIIKTQKGFNSNDVSNIFNMHNIELPKKLSEIDKY